MTTPRPLVHLGFTKERFPAGVHICQIFSEDDEREEALYQYVLSGIDSRERTACFSDKAMPSQMESLLARHGKSFADLCSAGALTLAATEEVYFKDNRFDPDRMVEVLTRYHDESQQGGFPAARVIGEMSPAVRHVSGGSRLLEYESKVSMLLRTHPVTCVCQYDARSFDGATIMDVLKVHPLMVLRGTVVRNPFFIPPEVFLGRS